MKRRMIIWIFTCTLVSLLSVTILFVLSEDLTHSTNSFKRIFPPHAISDQGEVEIDKATLYISGATRDNVYLSDREIPFDLRTINLNSFQIDQRRFRIRDSIKYTLTSYTVKVDSPDFYLMDGDIPVIFKGNLGDSEIRRGVSDKAYFSKIIPIKRGSFVVRSKSRLTGETVLGRIKPDSPRVELRNGLLKKQIDGIFCVDGMINYDKVNNKIIYAYYYRNQFLVMDTSLNILFVGKTIDTISRAKINVSLVHGGTRLEIGAPPLTVNRLSCAYDGYFYVNSSLMGNGETRTSFDDHSVIDVYDLSNGKYYFSFYIKNDEGDRMIDFVVNEGTLVALFKSRVRVYKLNVDYLKDT